MKIEGPAENFIEEIAENFTNEHDDRTYIKRLRIRDELEEKIKDIKLQGYKHGFSKNAENAITKEALGWIQDSGSKWLRDSDLDRDISRSTLNKWKTEIGNIFKKGHDLFGGLGKEDRDVLLKEIVEKGFSKSAEDKEIRMIYRSEKHLEERGVFLDMDELEKTINQRFDDGRKSIAQKFREQIKERENKEATKVVKVGRVVSQTDQSKQSDRSRKNTLKQQARRSKKSGLSLSI